MRKNQIKSVAATTLYFFLKTIFSHLNRVLKISSYFCIIIMCTHNGNFPQWIGRLSYLLSIVATNELALREASWKKSNHRIVYFSSVEYSNSGNRGLKEFVPQYIYKCGLAHIHCVLRLVLDVVLFGARKESNRKKGNRKESNSFR